MIRVERLADIIIAMIPSRCSMLDVGSGDGLLSYTIMKKRPDVSCTGLDILIRNNSYIPTKHYDGILFPFKDEEFDVVMFIDVLHHSDKQSQLLAEAKRVSKRYVLVKDHLLGGSISKILLKSMDWIGNKSYGVSLPYHYLKPPEWYDLFARAGFEILSFRDKLDVHNIFWLNYLEKRLHFIAFLEKRSAS